jgi:hypothetical protein
MGGWCGKAIGSMATAPWTANRSRTQWHVRAADIPDTASPVRTHARSAIVVAVACQQETKVEPLRENPELAATLKERQQRAASYEAARRMTPEEVAALEATLQQNPEDAATRDRLLTYYAWTGDNHQRWDENVAARRRHAVWLVENDPDSDWSEAWKFRKTPIPTAMTLFESLWLEHVERKDASPKVINNAAWFFRRSD